MREKLRKNLTIGDLSLVNFVNLNDQEKKIVLDWRNHKNVRGQMLTSRTISIPEHFNFIAGLRKNEKHFCWLVKKDSKNIGVIALHDVDFKNKHSYFGAYADPHDKNFGVGFLLFQTIIRLAFDVFKLHSLRGSTIGDNPVLYIHKKLGFREVGRYTDYLRRNGKWKDFVITEIINKK